MHVVFRRDRNVSSKNPGSGVDPRCGASWARRQGVLLLVTCSLHKQRKVTRSPQGSESRCCSWRPRHHMKQRHCRSQRQEQKLPSPLPLSRWRERGKQKPQQKPQHSNGQSQSHSHSHSRSRSQNQNHNYGQSQSPHPTRPLAFSKERGPEAKPTIPTSRITHYTPPRHC